MLLKKHSRPHAACLLAWFFLGFWGSAQGREHVRESLSVGSANVDMFYYKNSLHNHAQPGSAANDSTNVGNWIARLVAQSSNGNAATLGSMFGFLTDWTAPPEGNEHHSEISTPYIDPSAPSWAGAENIEVVGFVPDNFDAQYFDPSQPTNFGVSYRQRLLFLIDEWELNAPNPNRRYVIYSGWPDFGIYGVTDDDPANISADQLAAWRSFGLGQYQLWMQRLVEVLRVARPGLDIRLHNVNRSLLSLLGESPLNQVPPVQLFEDLAPHGRATWYFLAALIEYIEIFEEPPPTSFSFDPAWGVEPTVQSAYPEITERLWALRIPQRIFLDGFES